MVDSNFDGYMAIEGTMLGDQFHNDKKSIDYSKGIVAKLVGE